MVEGLNIDAGSVPLKASVKKYEELTRILKNIWRGKFKDFVFKISPTAALNLVARSGSKAEITEHLESLHISLNRSRIGNMMGEASPAGS